MIQFILYYYYNVHIICTKKILIDNNLWKTNISCWFITEIKVKTNTNKKPISVQRNKYYGVYRRIGIV